jgi:hypothetical protein
VLVRFWLQCVSRFTSAAWEQAAPAAIAPLLQAAVQTHVASSR